MQPPVMQSTDFIVSKIKTTKFTWCSAAMIYFLTCKLTKHIVIFAMFPEAFILHTQTCPPALSTTACNPANKFYLESTSISGRTPGVGKLRPHGSQDTSLYFWHSVVSPRSPNKRTLAKVLLRQITFLMTSS